VLVRAYERIAAIESYVEIVRFLETLHQVQHENKLVSGVMLEDSKYWRLAAEILLLRAKREAEE